MKKRSFSIKYRVLTYVFILLLPLTLITGIIAVVQVNDMQKQLIAGEQRQLVSIVSLLNQETAEIEAFLYDQALNNPVFRVMAEKQSPTQLYVKAQETYSSVETLLTTYKDLTFMALYSVTNDYYFSQNNGLDYLSDSMRIQLDRAIEHRMRRYFNENNLPVMQWFPVEIMGRYFLCRAVNNQGICCVCGIDLERLTDELRSTYGLEGSLVFYHEGVLLTQPDELAAEYTDPERLEKEQESLSISEKIYDLELFYIVPYNYINRNPNWSTSILILITVVVLTCLPLIYHSLKKNFFLPLDNLVNMMNSISRGNLQAEVDDAYVSREFRQVNDTVNQMISQIWELKIEQYENEIESRQAKLQFLQAQIRPHFYLNCLKTIYALSEQHDFENVGEAILLMSNHLRYAFQKQEEMVPLREELRLCENYVKLCELTTGADSELALDIDGAAFDTAIPPVSLLTFVENSVRFCTNHQKRLYIKITAHKLCTGDGDVLCMTVHDNGTGFTPEQLISMNGADWCEEASEHVGIQNVVRRFRLIYKDDFSFAFSNQDGALVELYIPIRSLEANARERRLLREASDS